MSGVTLFQGLILTPVPGLTSDSGRSMAGLLQGHWDCCKRRFPHCLRQRGLLGRNCGPSRDSRIDPGSHRGLTGKQCGKNRPGHRGTVRLPTNVAFVHLSVSEHLFSGSCHSRSKGTRVPGPPDPPQLGQDRQRYHCPTACQVLTFIRYPRPGGGGSQETGKWVRPGAGMTGRTSIQWGKGEGHFPPRFKRA